MSRAIRDEITGLILSRGLHSGNPLPTETELVEELGVSRNSVREALKALQALDIVEIRHGDGTYVGRLSLDPLADGLTFRALHDIGRDLRSMEEIVEVREALEGALIRRVAATVPAADLAALDEVTRRMLKRAKSGETFADEDREFHELLYRSLDNALVTQLLRAFWAPGDRDRAPQARRGPGRGRDGRAFPQSGRPRRTAAVLIGHRRYVGGMAAETGIGVSAGLAVGPVARHAAPPALPADKGREHDVAAAMARARLALDAVATELDARAERASGPAADVLFAQAMMPRDPALTSKIGAKLEAGQDLPHSVAAAFGTFRDSLAAAGGYLAERAADLDDVSHRTIAELLGLPMPGIPDPGLPFVLVATDLAPADTATLDSERVLAIVTEQGGPTSHTAILAKSLGIPAIVGCRAARDLTDGTMVLVDGGTGTMLVNPDPDEVRQATAQAEARARVLAASTGPGATADGKPVALLVNLGAASELAAAATVDSEGVGLLRTEFLYLNRATEPDVAEQTESYAAVFAAFAGRKVVVRTLDAGADKPLAFVDHGDEPNPALGVRGLRLAGRHPKMLDDQLAAIAAAAAKHEAEVWVMAPMVSTTAEATEFAELAHTHGLASAGVMVEVPAAALRASRVLAGCDFASIGTNDLGQYTMAADRMASELAGLLDPWQPALLELVARTARAGVALGKPVGVCGEAASDPLLALVLVGMGVSSLSMAPAALPAVRMALAAHTSADCERLASLALGANDAAQARELVEAAALPRVAGQ